MANFEYIEEVEAAAEEEAQKRAAESTPASNNTERASYWEELLKDRYEEQKVEEFNAMGKGKRSRKQVCTVILFKQLKGSSCIKSLCAIHKFCSL